MKLTSTLSCTGITTGGTLLLLYVVGLSATSSAKSMGLVVPLAKTGRTLGLYICRWKRRVDNVFPAITRRFTHINGLFRHKAVTYEYFHDLSKMQNNSKAVITKDKDAQVPITHHVESS